MTPYTKSLVVAAACASLLACESGAPVQRAPFISLFDSVPAEYTLRSFDDIPIGRVSDYAWNADTLVVADGANSTVRFFGGDGAEFRRIGAPGDGPGELRQPTAVALAPGGAVWIGDSRGKLLRWSSAHGLKDFGYPVVSIDAIVPDDVTGQLVLVGSHSHGDESFTMVLVDSNGTVSNRTGRVESALEPYRSNLQGYKGSNTPLGIAVVDRTDHAVLLLSRAPAGQVSRYAIPEGVTGLDIIEWPARGEISEPRQLVDFARSIWMTTSVVAVEGHGLLVGLSRGSPEESERIHLLFDGERFLQLVGGPTVTFQRAKADTLSWVGLDDHGVARVRLYAPTGNRVGR